LKKQTAFTPLPAAPLPQSSVAKKIAIIAAALTMAATGIWLVAGNGRLAIGERRIAAAVTPAAGRALPVEIIHHLASCNLEVPSSLPGTMRMSDGQIKARLGSGIEMILWGPFELEIQTPTKARLVSGRMLATIPWKHGGFMLRTPDLEMWDNGAVYCASVTDKGSDIFVFKGEAQVVEACGEPVDICRAGEGVRARRDGSGTVKVEANWPEGERILAQVMTKGVLDYPEEALLAASHVSDGWAERWMPIEAWRIAERYRIAAARQAAANRVQFSKEPWVRPAASAYQEEQSMRKGNMAALAAAAALIMGAEVSGGSSPPVRIDTSPVHNLNWTTLFTNAVPLRWEWPADAVSATLTVTDMHTSFVTNFTQGTTEFLWRPFATAAPRDEEVYALTLSFFDNGANEVQTLTAKLAALAGAFGAVPVDTGLSDRRWGKVKTNVVIPYDAAWAAATADAAASRLVIAKTGGATQEYLTGDASGYFGWKLLNSDWGYGTFALTLDFPSFDGAWQATLEYIPSGTVIRVR
jgi:hypothetical protein